MIYNIRLSAYSGSYSKLTEEDWIALRTVIPELPPEKPTYCYDVLTVGWEGMQELARLKVAIEFDEDSRHTGSLMWVKLQDRIRDLELREAGAAELTVAGAAVHIHVPDLGLLAMREVDWLEDACTVELQRRLDDGWRILAVCPPNAKRRPDYILGRSRKETR